ncbi:MAG: hypothetical protein NVS3B1_06080 [Marmoricola sp.]
MATEHSLRTCTVAADPWTYVPSEDAGDSYHLDHSLPFVAKVAIEKAGPGDLQCRECETCIGLTEQVRRDEHDVEHEYILWRPVIVVQDEAHPKHGNAWLLCEDCAAGLASP